MTSSDERSSKVRRLRKNESIEIARLFQSGATITALARKYNVHRYTIQVHLNKNGVESLSSPANLTDSDVQAAARLYESGQSLVTVAEQFQVSAETIATHLRRAGVQIRRRRGLA